MLEWCKTCENYKSEKRCNSCVSASDSPIQPSGYKKKEEKVTDILYLCNGRRDSCKDNAECYVKGGQCRYTQDINSAINFVKSQNRNFYMEVSNLPHHVTNWC